MQEWLESVGVGVPGYVTPKVAIGAIVGNDDGELLLVQRADSGIWLYPTGWADVGYSPAEVAVKEVVEETGIECEAAAGARRHRRPADGLLPVRHVHAACSTARRPAASCAATRWSAPTSAGSADDDLPATTAGAGWWAPMAFAAIRGEEFPTVFDAVRSPVWRP